MTENSSTSARPRALRLQFSLRLLLLAFTAFAIGFPIWYRWPYEEIAFETPPGSPTELKRITTWQRQWGGGRLKHGLQRLVSNGKTIESITYRNGLRHGPYQGEDEKGQFVDDLKDGVWVAPYRTSTWNRGKLHGPYELRMGPVIVPARFRAQMTAKAIPDKPRVFQLVFADGRLTHFDSKPATNRLFDLLETGAIERPLATELNKLTTIDVIEMPLKDTMLYLTEMHQIPIVIDPSPALQADMPITGQYQGIDLCSALTLITASQNLGCDYRYGCLWITTADDAKDWYDPTGVSEIKPPKDSALARVWNDLGAKTDLVGVPLAQALAYLEQKLLININTQLIQPTVELPTPYPVTHVAAGLPFHHILGQLLYKTRCRCRLEGETLIILPPETQ